MNLDEPRSAHDHAPIAVQPVSRLAQGSLGVVGAAALETRLIFKRAVRLDDLRLGRPTRVPHVGVVLLFAELARHKHLAPASSQRAPLLQGHRSSPAPLLVDSST